MTTPILGISNDIVFNGDTGADAIEFSVAGGLLHHNRGGLDGFHSNVDLDAVTPGDQTRAIADITSVSYTDSGNNDTFSFAEGAAFDFTNLAFTEISVLAREIALRPGSSITTLAGDVSLTANTAGAAGNFHGVLLDGASITSERGDIRLDGRGGNDAANTFRFGIQLQNGSVIESSGTDKADAATISLYGVGGGGTVGIHGMQISSGSRISSVAGDILLDGQAAGTENFNLGVAVEGGVVESTGTDRDHAAEITFRGVGGTGTANANNGIRMTTARVSSVAGDITLDGTGGAAANELSFGVSLFSDVVVESTGTVKSDAASITISGAGGAGASSNVGIRIAGGSEVTSVAGDVLLEGQGGGDGTGESNSGITLRGSTRIESTGTSKAEAATVTIRGTGGSGVDTNYGLLTIGATISSHAGDLVIEGQGGNGNGESNSGVVLINSTLIESTGTSKVDAATVTILGSGGNGVSNNIGVSLQQNSRIASATGDIRVDGQGGSGGGALNLGMRVIAGAEIESIGTNPAEAATITLQGTGSGGSSQGVLVLSQSVVSAIAADIAVTGTGSSGAPGIQATGIDAGSGNVTLTSLAGVIREDGAGTDFAGGTVTVNGELAPGSPIGVTVVDGNVALSNSDTYTVDLDGLTSGTQYDQVQVIGAGRTVTLGGATLNVDPGFAASTGDAFVIIDNVDATSTVSGTFAGLAEGAGIVAGGQLFFISYQGGVDGNDVVLTAQTAVTLTISDETILESDSGTTQIEFDVTLNDIFLRPLTVDFQTVDGTATDADNDYEPASGTLAFAGAAGEVQSFTVDVNGDEKVELDQLFQILLDNVQAAGREDFVSLVGSGSRVSDTVFFDAATPYLSVADIPTGFYDGGPTFVEDFEDGTIDGGILVDPALGGCSAPTRLASCFNPNGIDSVDADDGLINGTGSDGSGNFGEALWNAGATTVLTVSFPGLPTAAAVVWTDGGDPNTFEVFGPGGVLLDTLGPLTLNDGNFLGGTAEDRFIGFHAADGIESIRITSPAGGFEVDHVQYGNAPLSGATATGTIINDDSATVSVGDAQVVEGGDLEFPITLSNPVDVDTVITYSTVDGSATTADSDYTGATGQTITIPAGDTTGTITVGTTADNKVELDEQVAVTLSGVAAQGRDVTIDDGTGDGTIINDDSATVTVGDAQVVEGGDLEFPVTLSNPVDVDTVITYSTADNTATVADNDYTGASGTLTITAGQTTGTILVSTLVDNTVELDETMSVGVSGADAAGRDVQVAAEAVTDQLFWGHVPSSDTFADSYDNRQTWNFPQRSGPDGRLQFQLVDVQNAGPVIVADQFDPLSAVNNGQVTDDRFTFRRGNYHIADNFTLTAAAEIDAARFRVAYITLGSSENSPNGLIHVEFFNADGPGGSPGSRIGGVASVPATAAVPSGDTFNARPSTIIYDVMVPLAARTFAPGSYWVSAYGSAATIATGTIINDDSATVTVGDASVTEGGNLEFPVTLSNPVDVDTVITYSTVDGSATTADSDYTGATGQTITIPAGDTTGTITVVTSADNKVELDEQVAVTLSGVAAQGRDVSIDDETGAGTIINDDSATVTVGDAQVVEGGDLEFPITLSNPVDVDTAITYSTVDGSATTADSDYTGATGQTITIPAGDTTGTITVATNTDSKVELDETLTVNLTAVAAGGRNVSLAGATGQGTIQNDDHATISIEDVSQLESDLGQTAFVFEVTLSLPVDVVVSLLGNTADDTANVADADFVAVVDEAIQFSLESTSQSLTVFVIGDLLVEPNQSFLVNLSQISAAGRDVSFADNQAIAEILHDDFLGGRVFDDLDNDGQFEPGDGDAGIEGVLMQLVKESSGAVVDTAITGSNGRYEFASTLDVGTYKIVEVVDE